MCKYCECDYLDGFNQDIINKAVSENGDYMFVDILGNRLEIEVDLLFNNVVVSIDINYCPMCGRELLSE